MDGRAHHIQNSTLDFEGFLRHLDSFINFFLKIFRYKSNSN